MIVAGRIEGHVAKVRAGTRDGGLAGVADAVQIIIGVGTAVRVLVGVVVFRTRAASVRAVRYAVVVVVDVARVATERPVRRRLDAGPAVAVAVCLVTGPEYECFRGAVRSRGAVVTSASDEIRISVCLVRIRLCRAVVEQVIDAIAI